MLRKALFLITAAAFVIASAAAFAEPPLQDPVPPIERVQRPPTMKGQMPVPHHGPASPLQIPPKQMILNMGVQLAFTDEQKAKVEALANAARDKVRPLVDEQMKSMQALLKAIAEPTADNTAVEKAAVAAAKANASVVSAQVAFWMDMKQALTKEQNKKLGDRLLRFEAAPPDAFGLPRPGAPGFHGSPPGPLGPPPAAPGPMPDMRPGPPPGPNPPPGEPMPSPPSE